MKKWTTTSWLYRTFGHDERSERGSGKRWKDGIEQRRYFSPNYNNLQKVLSEVMDHCNREQMTVKSLFPLTSAQTLEYGQSIEWEL
jgi:hypothetical protein